MSAPSLIDVDVDFEEAVHAADATVRASEKRTREVEMRTARLLKKPKGEPFPFQEPGDVINAQLEAIERVTGLTSPRFDTKSDPRRVYAWVRDSIIQYGDECREEGRGLERSSAEPRIRPEAATEAMQLMARLNDLLSAPPTGYPPQPLD